MMKKLHLFYVFIFITLAACQGNSKKKNSAIETPEIQFRKDGELRFYDSLAKPKKTIAIEIAKSDYEQETGLMYRKKMKADRGMLFVYDNQRPRPNFYMKNTYIPLDLVYINATHKIVDFNKNAKPLNKNSLPSKAPAQYVLEINGGKVQAWQLNVGDSVSFTTK